MATIPELIRSTPLVDLLAQLERDLATLQRCAPQSDACRTLALHAEGLREALRAAAIEEALVLPLDEAATRLDLDPTALRRLCRLGRVAGARKLAGEWRIPLRFILSSASGSQEAA